MFSFVKSFPMDWGCGMQWFPSPHKTQTGSSPRCCRAMFSPHHFSNGWCYLLPDVTWLSQSEVQYSARQMQKRSPPPFTHGGLTSVHHLQQQGAGQVGRWTLSRGHISLWSGQGGQEPCSVTRRLLSFWTSSQLSDKEPWHFTYQLEEMMHCLNVRTKIMLKLFLAMFTNKFFGQTLVTNHISAILASPKPRESSVEGRPCWERDTGVTVRAVEHVLRACECRRVLASGLSERMSIVLHCLISEINLPLTRFFWRSRITNYCPTLSQSKSAFPLMQCIGCTDQWAFHFLLLYSGFCFSIPKLCFCVNFSTLFVADSKSKDCSWHIPLGMFEKWWK